MGKKEIIVVYFSYSGEYSDSFIGHKSINAISSSSILNKQHYTVSTPHTKKYEITFATCVLNLYA